MGGLGFPSGGGTVPVAGAGGCGLIILVVVVLLMGGDPTALINVLAPAGGGAPVQLEPAQPGAAPEDEAGQFAAAILGSTEDVWSALFQQDGSTTYTPPRLVLFTDLTPTGCGTGQAATGPFYCPADENVYLDLGFLNDLRRLGAPGDFAFAYVIAHEVGHHVQHLLGTDEGVRAMQARVSQADANQLSVLLELQADCFAGVWGHHADQAGDILEQGDIEEGLQAAAAVGDDRLLEMSGRPVIRDAFTHGSSEERASWLRTGLQTGQVDACDTFGAAGLR
jgi:predicted metalloprotease